MSASTCSCYRRIDSAPMSLLNGLSLRTANHAEVRMAGGAPLSRREDAIYDAAADPLG